MNLATTADSGQRTRTTSWAAIVLLISSCLVFAVAAYARIAAAPHFTHVGFWDSTRAELDPVVGLWLLASVTIGLANALIAAAAMLLARDVTQASARRWVRASVTSSAVALVASATYVFGYVSTARFNTPSLGGEALFWVAYVAGFVATLGVALSLTFLAVAWHRAGILRSRALVVVSVVVAVVAIALPPFAVGVLGLVFAIVRLRAVSASRSDAALS